MEMKIQGVDVHVTAEGGLRHPTFRVKCDNEQRARIGSGADSKLFNHYLNGCRLTSL